MCSHISKEYVVIGWDASGKKKKRHLLQVVKRTKCWDSLLKLETVQIWFREDSIVKLLEVSIYDGITLPRTGKDDNFSILLKMQFFCKKEKQHC